MTRKSIPTDYTEQEVTRRFEAALRGARIAGPQHKEIVTPKRAKSQQKKRAKKRSFLLPI
jgi:hypothetical protein